MKLEELDPAQMAAYINQLIEKDFSRLVQLLYRLDVSETKLRTVLKESIGLDAGTMIATLILERIAQSKKAREQFRTDREIPEDEKW